MFVRHENDDIDHKSCFCEHAHYWYLPAVSKDSQGCVIEPSLDSEKQCSLHRRDQMEFGYRNGPAQNQILLLQQMSWK